MKDLRKDFNYENAPLQMSEGHQQLFETKLKKESKAVSSSETLQKIAAVLIVALVSSILWLQTPPDQIQQNETSNLISLGDFSPEFQKIESFYQASINYELATLETGDYDDLVNSYVLEVEKIDGEYKRLQNELAQQGFDETLIEAMIENLQLRLELLQNLKLKLTELKTLNHDSESIYQL
ncbi:hypothetical protein pgond44_03463 [Psychroflexus gondwanensis ACAM 44]|uniref:Uncharacterized protein n=1 Tax=Psychroflexus gondwanensis ACAM 44 TaxID=1189619 RepID=N1X2H2_9FLAO|nr:hypothetical protein [Psychroflexus gondwanensis]EMY82263.1 hypothetical protein pgond44_03463 [Psychroflexus gondwanensis ACAM 44]